MRQSEAPWVSACGGQRVTCGLPSRPPLQDQRAHAASVGKKTTREVMRAAAATAVAVLCCLPPHAAGELAGPDPAAFAVVASAGGETSRTGPCYTVPSPGHIALRQNALRDGRCVETLPTEALLGFDEAQLGAIPSDLVPLLRDTHISFLSKEACADLPMTFVKGLSGAQCAGFSQTCIKAIPPAAFKFLQDTCVAHLSSDAVRGLTSDQLSQIPDVVVGHLTPAHLSSFSDVQCRGFTQGQVQHIKAACDGMSRTCLFALTPLQLGSIEKECWSRIAPTALVGFGLDRLRAIRDDSFPAATTPAQMAVLTGECAAFTGEQGEALKGAQCGEISISCGATLSLKGALNLSPECVLALRSTTFAALTPAALALLPGDAFCRVPSEHLALLPSASCAMLSKNQVMKLPHPTCLGLTLACINAMAPEVRPMLMRGCDPERDGPDGRGRPAAPVQSAPCDHRNWDQHREAAKANADKQAELDKKVLAGEKPSEIAHKQFNATNPDSDGGGGTSANATGNLLVLASAGVNNSGSGSNSRVLSPAMVFFAAIAGAAMVMAMRRGGRRRGSVMGDTTGGGGGLGRGRQPYDTL